MAFKSLHEFVITLEKKVKETNVTEKDGQKITVEQEVTKEVPVTVVMKELSRREKQEIALFQSVTYNEAIGKGLLPKLTMQQKIGKEASNPLSEEEDKNLTTMMARLQELATDYTELTQKGKDLPNADEVAERKQKLIMEYMMLSKKVIDINSAYQTVYAHTAETYMQTKTLNWLILFLTYVKDTPESAPRPLFNGTSYEAKEQSMMDMEDSNDPLFTKLMEVTDQSRGPKLNEYWGLYYLGRASKSEDFVQHEETEAKRIEYEKKMREEMVKTSVQSLPKEEPPKEDKKDEPPAEELSAPEASTPTQP